MALFTVALLLLLLLFLPYTLLLIFGQCVRSMSVRRRWVLWWIRSTAFISIMDAYHAPYRRRHRYWTGFLLLTRCVLFLVFATNNRDNSISENMYATTLVVVVVLLLMKMYRNSSLDILELCFHLNLIVLSITLSYLLNDSNADRSTMCKTTTWSFSVAFIFFIGILLYHCHLQLHKTRHYTAIQHWFLTKLQVIAHHRTTPARIGPATPRHRDTAMLPTTTLVELREELLASETQQ